MKPAMVRRSVRSFVALVDASTEGPPDAGPGAETDDDDGTPAFGETSIGA